MGIFKTIILVNGLWLILYSILTLFRTIKQIKYCFSAVETDHSKFDCFVLAVLTHGNQDSLCSYDGIPYNPHDIIFDRFTADKCPTLAGNVICFCSYKIILSFSF